MVHAPGFTIPVTSPSSHTFELPAGLHSVQVPALPGGEQRFTFSRSGMRPISVTGTEGINDGNVGHDLQLADVACHPASGRKWRVVTMSHRPTVVPHSARSNHVSFIDAPIVDAPIIGGKGVHGAPSRAS